MKIALHEVSEELRALEEELDMAVDFDLLIELLYSRVPSDFSEELEQTIKDLKIILTSLERLQRKTQ